MITVYLWMSWNLQCRANTNGVIMNHNIVSVGRAELSLAFPLTAGVATPPAFRLLVRDYGPFPSTHQNGGRSRPAILQPVVSAREVWNDMKQVLCVTPEHLNELFYWKLPFYGL